MNFVEGDRQILERFYPKPVGYQIAARTIIHAHCKELLELESRQGVIGNVRPTISPERLNELLGNSGSSGSDDSEREPSAD